MIKKFEIYDLFNSKETININFNRDMTILIGTNGCGKTTILNIINIILNDDYESLLSYKFKYIDIEYYDKNYLIFKFNNTITYLNKYDFHLNKDKRDVSIEDLSKLNLLDIITRYEDDDEDEFNINIDGMIELDYTSSQYTYPTLYFPTYRRSEIALTDLLLDTNIERILYKSRSNSGINKFKNTVIGMNSEDIEVLTRKKWIEVNNKEHSILNSLVVEMFMSLLKVDRINSINIDKVNEYDVSRKISEICERTEILSSARSLETKINTYTKNVKKAKELKSQVDYMLGEYIKGIEQTSDDLDEIVSNLKNTMEKIEFRRNIQYSLSQIFEIIDTYEEKCKNINDIKLPFKQLEDTLSEFMFPKIAKINRGHLLFENRNQIIGFDDLSAGEKQLVTMFLYIGLSVQKNGVVLIDEPELSLHMVWQRSLLSRIMNNRKDIQLIIATHSSSIVSNHRSKIHKIGMYKYE